MLIWHLTAIFLTLALVASSFDWQYFLSTRFLLLRSWFWPAVPIGGLLPMVLPLALSALGCISRSAQTRLVGWVIGQAEAMGGIIAAGHKALTGRAHPTHSVGTDLTHDFAFGGAVGRMTDETVGISQGMAARGAR